MSAFNAPRLPDWEDRLHEFVEANWSRAFEWGEHDCILAACSAVEAMTGTDPAVEFRGRYSDAEGAKRALRGIGQGTLIRTINHHFERRPPGMARRGDIVMFKGSAGIAMGQHGLFVGEERLAEAAGVRLREGFITIPRALWARAWSV